jgi:hypothetical protein
MNDVIKLDMAPEHLKAWKHDALTVKYRQFIAAIRADYKEQLARSATLHFDSVERTAMMTAKLLGVIEGLDILLDIEVEQRQEEGRE